MDDQLHHPEPRLPQGWKQYHADNIDVTTISDAPTNTATGRHSRSPSVLSNNGAYSMNNNNNNTVIQPSQIENTNKNTNSTLGNPLDDAIYGNSDNGVRHPSLSGILEPQFTSEQQQQQDMSHFQSPSLDEYEFQNPSEMRNSSVNASNSYFGQHDTAALTADHHSTATQNLNGVPENNHHHHHTNSNNANINDYYLSSTDPSSASPYLNATNTSPPILQDTGYSTYQNSFEQNSFEQNSYQPTYETDNNNLGLHWTHHRSRSDQSDISSNAASPFIGSVHSEHGSPFINAQPDNNLEDDLHEALLDLGLDMGAPQFDVATQYNPHNYDTSNLELDNSGFPIDAPLYPTSDRQEQQYYDQQPQQPQQPQQTSRPGSSSSYHHPPSSQSIFQYNQPPHISTSIPPSFQSPPLPSATSIPEIEVTVAPPTPRTQAFMNMNMDSYFPQPYNPHQHQQQQHSHERTGSPSIPPSYIYPSQDLALPTRSRPRAHSDSTRPTFTMVSPSNPNALQRRVSQGSHPYLGVHESSASSSGRSSPARGHGKSFSHGGHNMTQREVMDLVKNDGPREAKNPKKFVCDYPGCGQRFTRNSNKTYTLPRNPRL
jgi:hypothetical protein